MQDITASWITGDTRAAELALARVLANQSSARSPCPIDEREVVPSNRRPCRSSLWRGARARAWLDVVGRLSAGIIDALTTQAHPIGGIGAKCRRQTKMPRTHIPPIDLHSSLGAGRASPCVVGLSIDLIGEFNIHMQFASNRSVQVRT